VTYQWDAETELLAARLGEVRGSVRGTAAEGLYEGPNACGLTPAVSGSIELEGRDGSWLTLDVRNGRIEGIAVAVWPRIVRRPDLRAPTRAEYVHEMVRVGRSEAAVSSLEISARLVAEVADGCRTVHLSLARPTRVSDSRVNRARALHAVRIARDVLLEVDATARLAGLWLLNVPPDSVPIQ